MTLQIEDLSYANIEATATNIDWREAMGEDMDGWRSAEAFECPTCGQIKVTDSGEVECDHKPTCECGGPARYMEPDQDGEYECEWCRDWFKMPEGFTPAAEPAENIGYAEGPMMNYAWPIDMYPSRELEDMARSLINVPLCPVQMESGEIVLALTGGGMDLSWQIAEAYILLGSYPPFTLDLPGMAGKYHDPDWEAIVAACDKSAEAIQLRASQKRQELQRLSERIREEAHQRETASR